MRQSKVIKYLQCVWTETNTVFGASWERLNGSMRSALYLAISAGFKFEIKDFENISEMFNFGYWAGTDGHMWGEGYYTFAVESKNRSAAISFEAWKKRKAFMFGDISSRDHLKQENVRLAIGSEFRWPTKKQKKNKHRPHGFESVKVTSFSEDGEYLTACSYHEDIYTKCEKCRRTDDIKYGKVKKRFKILRQDLHDEKKRRKEIIKALK